MNKDRKRAPGAGRKPQGITRKVSLTLTEAEWADIDESGLTVAAYIKQLRTAERETPEHAPGNDQQTMVYPSYNPPAERAPRVSVALGRHEITHVFHIAANEAKHAGTPVPDEDISAAEQRLLELLYPKGAEHAQLAVLLQYVCPATGKRFGSADKLIRALAPRALEWPANERARKQANLLSQARKASLGFDQIR